MWFGVFEEWEIDGGWLVLIEMNLMRIEWFESLGFVEFLAFGWFFDSISEL